MTTRDATVHRWADINMDHPLPLIDRQRIVGDRMMIASLTLHQGFVVPVHEHENEQFALVMSGRMRFTIGRGADAREVIVDGGEVLHLPGGVPHGAEALETSIVIDLFSPPAESTGVDA